MDVTAVSRFLGVLAVVAGPGALLVVAMRRRDVIRPVREHALELAAAVAATAMLGSLYYSEVAGFIPCELCWYQRIAMYSLAVLLVVAVVRRDAGILPYAQVLAGIGLAVSTWHVALQRVPSLAGASTCSTEAPCSVVWVEAFGVLTIPTMAACGFLAVLVLSSVHDRSVPARAERPSRPTVLTTQGE